MKIMNFRFTSICKQQKVNNALKSKNYQPFHFFPNEPIIIAVKNVISGLRGQIEVI